MNEWVGWWVDGWVSGWVKSRFNDCLHQSKSSSFALKSRFSHGDISDKYCLLSLDFKYLLYMQCLL